MTSLQLEKLDPRLCPAAVLTARLDQGILTVEGTEAADQIVISQSGGWILAAGRRFNANAVSHIVVTALGGNDRIVIDTSVQKNTTIYGGFGDDTIYGGNFNDTIYGGFGNDVIYGRGGNDVIYGGAGNDRLDGGTGSNRIFQGSPTPTLGNSAIENEIIALVNRERQLRGLAPLRVNPSLNYAADLHSLDMARLSPVLGPYNAHQHNLYGTYQPLVSDRFEAAGYMEFTRSITWGENIAFGYRDAVSVMNAWMASAGHRANILNANFTEIGVSVRADSSGRLFFTQNFGGRS